MNNILINSNTLFFLLHGTSHNVQGNRRFATRMSETTGFAELQKCGGDKTSQRATLNGDFS
jgi:hypothetical protein